jgi:RNA polymerase sigma factor (sigma-70 family)
MLVKRYRRPLLAYARRISGSDARAEDALQQALLQAWVALKGGAQPTEVRPWLFRIVHNVVVNGLRRPQHPCVELDEARDAADRGDSAQTRLECRDALTGLAALPDLQRRAIVLTAFGGSSHDEVAAQLGLSDGAVRGLIYRARATLREAAAALLPMPIAGWLESHGIRRPAALGRTAELLAGGGSVGAGGVLIKAGAIAATAGALATASQLIVPAAPPARAVAHAGVVRPAAAGDLASPRPSPDVRAGAAVAMLRSASVVGSASRPARDPLRVGSFQAREPIAGGRARSARLSGGRDEGTSGGSDGGGSSVGTGPGEHGTDGASNGSDGGGSSGPSGSPGTSGMSSGSSGDGGGGSDGGSTPTSSASTSTKDGGGSDGGSTLTTTTDGGGSDGGGTLTTSSSPSTSDGGGHDGGGTSGDTVTTTTSDGGGTTDGGTTDGGTTDGGGGSSSP